MNFEIEEYKDMDLSPNAYLLLYSLVIEDTELQSQINNKTGNSEFRIALYELQEQGYIIRDNFLVFKKKVLSLRDKINPEPQFEEFWNKYHEVTGLHKTDLQAANKYWIKLTKNEKQKALDNIQNYYDSLPVYSTGRPVKKARTYLGDKNFNDEFEIIETKSSLNKMK